MIKLRNRKRDNYGGNRMKMKTGILFILPSFLGVIIFFLIPYMDVFRRAFYNSVDHHFDFNIIIHVFQNDAFKLAMKNTGKLMVISIPILLLLSLFFAYTIFRMGKHGNLFKSAFLIPMAIPVACVVLLWKLIFDQNGFLSGMLAMLGGHGTDWMNTNWSFWILVFSYIWRNLGYNIVLWLAGLNMISAEIYEAARVDGAGNWQCFRYITIPNLYSTSYIITVLAIINSFKVFREAYLVAGDYPHESIYLIQHLFNNWFRNMDLDKIAGGAVINSVIIMMAILLLQRLWDKER